MGLFDQEHIRILHFREDYNIFPGRLNVEEYASDVVTKKKNMDRDKSWELAHPLMKRCYGIPGIKDGTKALMICSRDVVWDPLNQYPEKYNKDEVRKRMGEMAHEQQHKAEGSKNSGPMNITTILLGASAFILILALVLIAGLRYYRGM